MNNQKGFVLVDAIIAILFAAIAFVGAAHAYNQSILNYSKSDNYNQAVLVVRQVADDVKTNTALANFESAINKTVTVSKGNKTYSVEISPHTLIGTNTYQITFKTSWVDRTGNNNVANSFQSTYCYYVE